MALDRSFTIRGAGTVVTGTVQSGRVTVGDHLLISPSHLPVRIRGLHQHGCAVMMVAAGERCAANLAGARVGAASIGRGAWLLDPSLHRPTDRLDVKLRLSAGAKHPLRHWSLVLLHIGATQLDAHVALLDADELAPGRECFAQLVLDGLVSALHGDRFILRDHAGRNTLGGGHVLDPWPSNRGRRKAERLRRLGALDDTSAATVLSRLSAASSQGVDLNSFAQCFNLNAAEAAALFMAEKVVIVGEGADRTGFARTASASLRADIERALMELHRRNSVPRGYAADIIRRSMATSVGPAVFQEFVRELIRDHIIVSEGNLLRHVKQGSSFTDSEEGIWADIFAAIRRQPFHPPAVGEHAARLRLTGSRNANTPMAFRAGRTATKGKRRSLFRCGIAFRACSDRGTARRYRPAGGAVHRRVQRRDRNRSWCSHRSL